MRIGLISDTHDRLPAIRAALETFERAGVEVLLHPGDLVAPFAAKVLADFPGVLHVTYGNNDGEREGLRAVLPKIQDGPFHIEIGGKRILIHHFVDWCREEDVTAADIIVTGHTHHAAVERRDGRLYVNPGECCGWVTGRCTVAILDIPKESVELIEVCP